MHHAEHLICESNDTSILENALKEKMQRPTSRIPVRNLVRAPGSLPADPRAPLVVSSTTFITA